VPEPGDQPPHLLAGFPDPGHHFFWAVGSSFRGFAQRGG
jgi:hypothetical protein